MTLPVVEPLVLWRRPDNTNIIVGYLVELIDKHPSMSKAALALDPISHLQDSGIVTVTATDTPLDDGGIQGAYNSAGPTIRYNQSGTPERDAFTVLHELGHHLQRTTAEWSFGVLSKLPSFDRNILEEAVCDELASRVLIDDALVADAGDTIDSAYLEKLHRRSNASRRATVMRALGVTREKILLAVADSAGRIQFSRSSSDAIPFPPIGSVQPDIARLFAESVGSAGTATGTAREGIRYSSGKSRSDFTLSVTVDSSGVYAFVTGKPTYSYGDPMWHEESRECSSEACGELFTWTAETNVCSKCNDPKCPNCGACACEPMHTPVCQGCWTELTLGDVQSGRTMHEECQ
jgi:Zn-dependent peptidase ImmA (M78 family)